MDARYDFRNFRCSFENENGECTGNYDGFGCIKDKCEIYGLSMLRADNRKVCSYNQDNYCARFKKFNCPGVENCSSIRL